MKQLLDSVCVSLLFLCYQWTNPQTNHVVCERVANAIVDRLAQKFHSDLLCDLVTHTWHTGASQCHGETIVRWYFWTLCSLLFTPKNISKGNKGSQHMFKKPNIAAATTAFHTNTWPLVSEHYHTRLFLDSSALNRVLYSFQDCCRSNVMSTIVFTQPI